MIRYTPAPNESIHPGSLFWFSVGTLETLGCPAIEIPVEVLKTKEDKAEICFPFDNTTIWVPKEKLRIKEF